MCQREVALGRQGEGPLRRSVAPLGLGALFAVTFLSTPASTAEPDNLVKAVKVLPDKAVDRRA